MPERDIIQIAENNMAKSEKHISKTIHLDNGYFLWLAEIKNRYRSAQLKAAVKVNSEKLAFNWQLGAELVQKKAEERWGIGVVEQLSKDLQNEFPNTEGFTIRNLQSMKQWYLFYSSLENEQKLKQAVSQFPNLFAFLGWSHHITIIQKCKDIDEALFYVQMTYQNQWGRDMLQKI